MGEVIHRISNKNLPKNLKEKYSTVEHIKEAGRIAIYGIEKDTKKKKRISTKKLVESYGYDSSKRPKSVRADWNKHNGPEQVIVTGSYGTLGGEEYMKVKGSKTGIPRSELKWRDYGGETAENGGLQAQVTELTDRVKKLECRLDEVLSRNQELETQNQELQTRNQELEAELEAYKNSDIKIIPAPGAQESDHRYKSALNRATGWVGRKLPGGGPAYDSGEIVKQQDGTPVMVVEEEWRDGYTYGERRRGAAALLLGAAAVGAAVLAAGLWGEHEEHEASGPRTQTTVIHKTVINNNENPLLKAENSNLKHLLHLKNIRIRSLEREEKQEKSHTEHALGEVFYVEPGNGITNEIQDYAQAYGYQEVNGAQAWMLYSNMRERFGTDLVELPGGGDDTYIRPQGDVGISRPGEAKWPEHVEKFLQSRLSR